MTLLKALKKIFGKGPTQLPAAVVAPTSPVIAQAAREPQPSRPRKPRATATAASSANTVESSAEQNLNNVSAQVTPTNPRRERPIKVIDTWKLEDFVVEPAEGKTRFHDFKLAPELMHAIQDLGFPYCTPIQAQVLGYTLAGKDAIGRAQTGTGKTAAFLVSIITQLLNTPPPKERYMGEPRALIIAPTRELVVQ
ncbi:MAG: DEAD/DEAH box helicase, partial [Pseudomonadaceae bacterium]|nr:DEAD/DEAH box helicase [Pseudomonadaceae bacterium]